MAMEPAAVSQEQHSTDRDSPDTDQHTHSESLPDHQQHRNDDNNEHDGPTTSTAQATKAIDMADGDAWFPRTPSRPASLASASTDPYGAIDQRSLLTASPPPPDYAEAIATPEHAPLISAVEEEEDLYSSDGPIVAVESFDPASKRRSWRKLTKAHWKKLCLVNLCIYCAIATIILIVGPTFSREAEVILPVMRPGWVRDRESRPDDFSNRPAHCLFDPYHGTTYSSMTDSKSFSFEEAIQESGYWEFGNVTLSGTIEVRPAYYTQIDPIELVVSYATTPGWQADLPQLHWSSGGQSVQLRHESPRSLKLPDLADQHNGLKRAANVEAACLDIWVGVFTNAPLDHVRIHTENMNINVGVPSSAAAMGLFWAFRVHESSYIHSHKGNITAMGWDSRSAYITSETGSIKGHYSLNDELILETRAGDIKVDVSQESAARRELHAASTVTQTPAILNTTTDVGNQAITLWQPSWETAARDDRSDPYRLRSSHISGSGRISIDAGAGWEGFVHTKTVDGSVLIQGEQFEYVPGDKYPIHYGGDGAHAGARRGTFDSTMTIETQQGDICVKAESFIAV